MLAKLLDLNNLFLTKMAIYIVDRWKKSMTTLIFQSAIMHRKVIHVNIFLFLAMFTVCRDPAVVMDPEILLPWQRETTSHLCISIEVSYCQWPLIKMVTFFVS